MLRVRVRERSANLHSYRVVVTISRVLQSAYNLYLLCNVVSYVPHSLYHLEIGETMYVSS